MPLGSVPGPATRGGTRAATHRSPRPWFVVVIIIAAVLQAAQITGMGVLLARHRPRAEAPLAHPAPWPEGATISPVSTEDDVVRSVVRAGQYVDAWDAAAPAGTDHGQVTPAFDFDPLAREGEAVDLPVEPGSGLDAYFMRGDDRRQISIDEYDDSGTAASALRKATSIRRGTAVTAPALPHAAEVVVLRSSATITPCRPDNGDPTALSLYARIDDEVVLTVLSMCFGAGDEAEATAALTARARAAIGVIMKVRQTPIPVMWMSDTDDVPIISSGSWYQHQRRIAGRADGLDLDRLLPAPFPGTGVQEVFDADATVYAYATAGAAHRLLTLVPGIDTESAGILRAPQPADPGDSDERLCADGLHPQQRGTCWSRVGRFVVVQRTEYRQADGVDEAQVDALRGVH